MPTLKYDVSNVEDLPDRTPAPVGTYRGKIVKAEPKQSGKGNSMIEVQWRLTHDAQGKKLKEEFQDIWDYPILDHDHPFVQNRLKEFIAAVGLKPKGSINTEKLVGVSAQLKLKSDTDQDGDYRPRIGKLMPLSGEDEGEPEEEPEEPDEPADDEDDDDDAVDLDALDRKELKQLIKDEELDISVKKSMTDDDIREAIAEAMGGDDDDDEDDEDDDEDDDTGSDDEGEGDDDTPDYDSMSVKDLKAELSERELPTNGGKKALVERLKKDDGEEPF